MECDSVHSLIERKLKNENVFVPEQYLEICRNSRKNPRPLNAELLDFKFFKNYNKNLFVDSIRPGKKTNDPTVFDIRALKYESKKMFYKLSHDATESFKQIPGTTNTKFNATQKFQQLNKNKIPIGISKEKDLRSLKDSIPQQYHYFYANLMDRF